MNLTPHLPTSSPTGGEEGQNGSKRLSSALLYYNEMYCNEWPYPVFHPSTLVGE